MKYLIKNPSITTMKKYESFYKLLRETDVNKVLEAVEKMYYADKPEESYPYAYKGAYDQLLHMKPDEIADDKGGNGIHVYQCKLEERRFAVTNCEGMKWRNAISFPVVVDDTIELTPEETVAAILWALTFYGFSEEETYANFEDMDREMDELELIPYDPDDDNDEEEEEIFPTLSPEEEEKRRLEERAKKVENTMMKLLAQSEGLSVKELSYLLDTSFICEIYPHTYAFDVTKRMDYMLDLLENYCKIQDDFNRVALCITSSPLHPMTEKEETKLVRKLKEMVKGGKVLMAKRQHMAIATELQSIILFSKD